MARHKLQPNHQSNRTHRVRLYERGGASRSAPRLCSRTVTHHSCVGRSRSSMCLQVLGNDAPSLRRLRLNPLRPKEKLPAERRRPVEYELPHLDVSKALRMLQIRFPYRFRKTARPNMPLAAPTLALGESEEYGLGLISARPNKCF